MDGFLVIFVVYGMFDFCIKIDFVNGIFVDIIVYRIFVWMYKKFGMFFIKKLED